MIVEETTRGMFGMGALLTSRRTTLRGVKDPQQLILSIVNSMARKIFIGGNWKCVGCAQERGHS